MSKLKQAFPFIITYIISCILLIIPALWNGYPLVYSDTGTYILANPTHTVPVDRAIGYSIYVQWVGMRFSLWFVIISHALFIIFLIDQILKKILQVKFRAFWIVIIIAILCATTGIDNYVSQVMPDIWMAIMILCIILILYTGTMKHVTSYLLSFLFLIATLSHHSNLLAATIILGALFLIYLVFRIKFVQYFKGFKIFTIWCLAAWLLAPGINLYYNEGFRISRAKWVPFTARLIQDGMLQDYLKENCSKNDFILCPYKDSIPKDCIDFLWGNSALYKGECKNSGWGTCWVKKDKEFGILVKSMLKTPKYFKRFIIMAITSTYQQLLNFNIGMMATMRENSPPYYGVKTIYSRELNQYISSKQYHANLFYDKGSKIQRITVIISFIALFIIWITNYISKKPHRKYCIFSFLIITGLVLNAFICGTLSMVTERYQARVIWLFPFLAIFSIIALVKQKLNKGSYI